MNLYTINSSVLVIQDWGKRPRRERNGKLARYAPTNVVYRFNAIHGDWVRPSNHAAIEASGTASLYATVDGDENEATLNAEGWNVFKAGAGAITTDGTRVTLDSGANEDQIYLRPTWAEEDFLISGYFNVDNYVGPSYGISIYTLKNSTDTGFTFVWVRDDSNQYAVFTNNASSAELTQDRIGGDYDLYQNEQWVELYCDTANEIATAWIGHSAWPTHRISSFSSQATAENRLWIGDFAGTRSADVIIRQMSLTLL